MQGGALGDSHAVVERAKKAGLLVEPMERPMGGRFTSLGLKTGRAPIFGLERPADKCAAAGGSPYRSSGTLGVGGRPVDGPCGTWWDPGGRKLREVDGTWRHRGACVEAKRSRQGGVGVRSKLKDLDENAPPYGLVS